MNEISQHHEIMETFLVAIIFRKIIKYNAVNISKIINEYYQKIIPKSGHKMDLYPVMYALSSDINGSHIDMYIVVCLYIT